MQCGEEVRRGRILSGKVLSEHGEKCWSQDSCGANLKADLLINVAGGEGGGSLRRLQCTGWGPSLVGEGGFPGGVCLVTAGVASEGAHQVLASDQSPHIWGYLCVVFVLQKWA